MHDALFLTDDSPTVTEVVRRFEEAWREAGRPDVERYLPARGPDYVRLLFELVHVDLDFRLRSGESALVEHYLDRFPDLGDDPSAMVELIAAEYALRRHWRGAVALEEYPRRFPQYQAELRTRLADGMPAASPPRPSVPGYELIRELGRG